MITKTYKANTNISINVVLPSKKNLHISFNPLSNGSSTFTTDNEELQNAIEKHYNFGKLFRLFSQHGESSKKEEKKVIKLPVAPVKNDEDTAKDDAADNEPVTDTEEAENTSSEEVATDIEETAETETETEEESTLRKVQVSDLAAAKDYLADTFGISRTVLRSKKAIVEQAAANGIEFEGLS